MDEKECRACGVTRPLTDFYKHPAMPDGRLNQCKECKKNYSRARYAEKSADSEWMERERERCREKHHRLYASGRKWVTIDAPEEVKAAARTILNNAVRDGKVTKPDRCTGCGNDKDRLEGHHQDYHKPLEVVWLCRKCHANVHIQNPDGSLHPLLVKGKQPTGD